MAADRGGLSYTVSVKDDFSAATAEFISGISAAKDAFAQFRAEVAQGRGASSTIREAAKATREAAKSTTTSVAQQEAALKRAAASARQLQSELARVERRRAAAASAATRQEQAAILAERQRLRAFLTAERTRERESRRILASLRRDEAAFQRDQIRQIQDVANRRADAERQRLALSRAARAEQAALDKLNPTVQGKRKAEELIARRSVAQAELAQLRQLGREDLITRQLRRQAGELASSARSANSLLFTFRRLVGVLAAFQIARAVVQGFRDLVTLGISFNDEVRQAEIGIAGLITGLSDVRTAQGQSVDLANEYARAQGEARRQVALLRQDALRTTATFQQLLQTFQVAIAPGFAAGLNLDEIRKLSVSISQAATAIGLPQNQLAEEIRSLLSGTIQARTTRIATALQITNADIRRLKATGELFDFLETRFKALGLAAEQAARQTLDGIGTLIKDATGAILGQAAQPLFEELIRLGNEVFDQFLTIRTAAGDIRPNPEAIKAFQTLFEALRDGVRQAADLGRELGFKGLQNALQSFGAGLNATFQFVLGLLRPILTTFNLILSVLRGIGNALRFDVGDGLGTAARQAGELVGIFLVLRQVAKLTGFDVVSLGRNLGSLVRTISSIGPASSSAFAAFGTGGVIGIAIVAVLKGFELIFESILGINLNLKETAQLIGLSLLGALQSAVTEVKVFAAEVQFAIAGLLASAEEKGFIEDASRRAVAVIRAVGKAEQEKTDARIQALLAAAQDPQVGPQGAPGADAAGAAVEEFGNIVSNVESIVAKANAAIGELDTELKGLQDQFDASGGRTGAQGFAGEVESAFADAASSARLKSREIAEALLGLQQQIAKGVGVLNITPDREAAIRRAAATPAGKAQDRAVDILKLTAEEGKFLSALRDEARLKETIADLEFQTRESARLKVAIQARELLPTLQRELVGLRAQAEAEGAVAAAVTQRLGARRLEAVEAQNALATFRADSQERLRLIRENLAAARAQSQPLSGLATAEDDRREKQRAAASRALADELQKTLDLEEAIAAAKEQQLAFAARQAQLAAEGSFTAGLRAGFEQLANDLPTLFDAAKNIVTGIVQSFTSAAGGFFRDLFDPRVQADAGVAFGEFLLSAGQLIFEQTLQTLIQSLISSVLTTTATELTTAQSIEVLKNAGAAARNAAAIATAETVALILASSSAAGGFSGGGVVPSVGLARGGRVPSTGARRVPSTHRRARGYARGGRPRGLDPRDTVPAFLQPGEFVVRKAVVDSLGLGFFQSVNAGRFSTPPPAAPAAGPGFASGGRVVKREPAAPSRSAGGDTVQVVPAIVTSEREMDRLQAGGKSAQLRFMRENAGTIRGILGV